LRRGKCRFDYPFEPAGVVDLFRDGYGPTARAFAALPADGKAALRDDLVNLWAAHNRRCEPGRLTQGAMAGGQGISPWF
jgi:hypothetical protein